MSNIFTQYDSTSSLFSYILDIKPYHTKILDIELAYKYVENVQVSMSDSLKWVVLSDINFFERKNWNGYDTYNSFGVYLDGPQFDPPSSTTVAPSFKESITFKDVIKFKDNVNISIRSYLTERIFPRENVGVVIDDSCSQNISLNMNYFERQNWKGYDTSHSFGIFLDGPHFEPTSATTAATSITEKFKLKEIERDGNGGITTTEITDGVITLFTFEQVLPSSQWIVPHRYEYMPIVRVYTDTGEEIMPMSVIHDGVNKVIIEFNTPRIGVVRLI